MQVPLRLYAITGCAHCMEAEKFLFENKVPCQLVVADQDAIATLGVSAATGANTFPVLVSFITGQVIVGYSKADYERLAKVFHSMYPSKTPESPVQAAGSPAGRLIELPKL